MRRILFIVFLNTYFVFGNLFAQQLEKQYEDFVAFINRGSYADSAAVFSNGNKVISIAEQLNSPSKKGLEYAEISDDIRLPFNLENNIGLIYNDKKEFEKAISHYENTLNRAKALGFPSYLSVSYVNLSNSHNQLGNHELSIMLSDSTLKIMVELDDRRNIPKTYFLKATAYLDLGNTN